LDLMILEVFSNLKDSMKDFLFSAQIPTVLNSDLKQYYVYLLHSLLWI